MTRINVIQGTYEWHEARYRKIGGSTSKGLFTTSDTLLKNLLAEFMEDFELEDGYQSSDMIRGSEMESYAREELIKYSGVQFNEVGWLQCDEIPLLGISPDGMSDDDKDGCELKCPSKEKHTETILNNDIPLDHIPQCIHYFTVNPKLERLHFVSFRPENKYKPLFVKVLTRDSVVNIGTKARPIAKRITECVEIAKSNAIQLQKDIDSNLESLSF